MKINRKQLEIELARAKMDRKKLAETSGLSLSQINDIFYRRSCTTESAGKLASSLGCDVTDIIL